MRKIVKIKGYELLDSRGNPTVAAKVYLSGGATGFAIVPSGASTGSYEAAELRDGGNRYFGKGVQKAVENINGTINTRLKGISAEKQEIIDDLLIKADASPNKSALGANAILAVSEAVAKAAASSYNLPLYRYLGGTNAAVMPRPMMNVLNGGAHAKNNLDIQEFMIVPPINGGIKSAVKCGSEIYHTLGRLLRENGKATGVGDEGGYAPDLENDEEAIKLLCRAIDAAGYSLNEVKIALDVASSEWQTGKGNYKMPKSGNRFTTDELIKHYEYLCKKYPIISVEDGLGEDDWQGTRKLTGKLGHKVQIVGDDLFVTNNERLHKGIDEGAANAILIKPNQIGTVSETLTVINTAIANGYKTVISHRSGDSEDAFIADLAVGVNAGQIKTGAPCRSERTAKYNRLMVIENEITN